jgi:hypothetical protein
MNNACQLMLNYNNKKKLDTFEIKICFLHVDWF